MLVDLVICLWCPKFGSRFNRLRNDLCQDFEDNTASTDEKTQQQEMSKGQIGPETYFFKSPCTHHGFRCMTQAAGGQFHQKFSCIRVPEPTGNWFLDDEKALKTPCRHVKPCKAMWNHGCLALRFSLWAIQWLASSMGPAQPWWWIVVPKVNGSRRLQQWSRRSPNWTWEEVFIPSKIAGWWWLEPWNFMTFHIGNI